MHPYLAALWTKVWTTFWTTLKARWDILRREPEAGYSTETVLVTALLVILALAALAVIATKVAAKAQNIDLGIGPW